MSNVIFWNTSARDAECRPLIQLCLFSPDKSDMPVRDRLETQILETALERLRFDLRYEPAELIPWPQIADSLERAHEELLRQGHVGHEMDVEQLIIAASFMAAGPRQRAGSQKEAYHLANQVFLYWINHARYQTSAE
jgi:hypothetical protein